MNNFLMKPKIDFAFKEIMQDEKARTGFLAAVLHLNPNDIRKTELLNTDLRKVHINDKLGILDIRISMNDNTEIDTEIQLSELKIWSDRALFYLSKIFTEQIEQGQDYNVLKKCVSISILDFKLFKDAPDFYSCFHIREDRRGFLFSDKMEFHVIELPKLPDLSIDESNGILLWAKFINAERKEDFDMLAEKDPYIDSAYQKLQVISQDKQKRMEYEARQKAILDHNQFLQEARQSGLEEGISIGEKQGEAKKTIDIAKNLIAAGLASDLIADATGLSLQDVEALRNHSY